MVQGQGRGQAVILNKNAKCIHVEKECANLSFIANECRKAFAFFLHFLKIPCRKTNDVS